MEGILGALYVSDNCALEGTEKFFSQVFRPFFDEFVTFEMLARHAADAVLEMLNRLGCRQYSRSHTVENGVHSCKSECYLPVPPRHTKRNSRLAREHALRSQGRQFGRGDAKGERKVLADIDGEAKTPEGRVQLPNRATNRGDQAWSEEKINLFVCVSVGRTLVYFLDLGAGLDSTAAYRASGRSLTVGNKRQGMGWKIRC